MCKECKKGFIPTVSFTLTQLLDRYLEGARWDTQKGLLRDSFLKELHPILPVMHLTAVEVEGLDMTGKYECPIFYTATRGGTFTFAAQLKTGAERRNFLLFMCISYLFLFFLFR